jgi:glycerol-3-phosphate dehydrogenase
VALNHAEALDPIVAGGRVEGLRVRDRVADSELELRAPLVLNAAGPETARLAGSWQRGAPSPQVLTLAWNVLLDVEPAFAEALAVAAPRRGAPVLFVVPWEGRLLAGTGHAALTGDPTAAVPADALARFLADLSAALPGLGIREERVLRVYRGLLPGVRVGSAQLSRRPVVVDHASRGGPRGLWSVSGVKFTTARRVAETALRRATGRPLVGSQPGDREGRSPRLERLRFGPDWRPESDPEGRSLLRSMIVDESAVHLDDLLLRRTALGDDPRGAHALAPSLAHWFGEDAATQRAECARVMRALDGAREPLP